MEWIGFAVLVWVLLAVPAALVIGRAISLADHGGPQTHPRLHTDPHRERSGVQRVVPLRPDDTAPDPPPSTPEPPPPADAAAVPDETADVAPARSRPRRRRVHALHRDHSRRSSGWSVPPG